MRAFSIASWIILGVLLFIPAQSLTVQVQAQVTDPATNFPKQAMLIRVVDENDQPVEGVKIHRSVWTKVKFPANADILTNRQGEVNLIFPQAEDILRLWASKKAYVPLFVNFDKRDMGGAQPPQDLVFHLQRGSTIGGFVVDESGAPIRGAKVEVSVSMDNSTNASGPGKGDIEVDGDLAEDARWTDEKGFWSLDNVPPDHVRGLYLWLSHPDFVSDLEWRSSDENHKKIGYTLSQVRAQNARLVMKRGVKIRGAIKDQEGKPLEKAMVVWGHEPYHNPRHQETFTDKDGIYHLPPMDEAPTVLTIVAEGFAPQLRSLTPSGVTMSVDFNLQHGQTTIFTFVGPDGKPVPQVVVNIAGWRNEETLFNWHHSNVPDSLIPDHADANGLWKWTWAPDDAVQYYFFKQGFADERKVSFGPGEHEVVLKRK